jgi:argininosuccinate lyase
MQEDKEPLFDAVETTLACLHILAPLIQKTKFNTANMKKALGSGFVLATDLADYLATRGIPFRQAHRIVGEIVAYCHGKQIELKELKLDEFRKFEKCFKPDVYDWLDEQHAVDRRRSLGGTSRINARRALTQAKQNITKNQKLISKIN